MNFPNLWVSMKEAVINKIKSYKADSNATNIIKKTCKACRRRDIVVNIQEIQMFKDNKQEIELYNFDSCRNCNNNSYLSPFFSSCFFCIALMNYNIKFKNQSFSNSCIQPAKHKKLFNGGPFLLCNKCDRKLRNFYEKKQEKNKDADERNNSKRKNYKNAERNKSRKKIDPDEIMTFILPPPLFYRNLGPFLINNATNIHSLIKNLLPSTYSVTNRIFNRNNTTGPKSEEHTINYSSSDKESDKEDQGNSEYYNINSFSYSEFDHEKIKKKNHQIAELVNDIKEEEKVSRNEEDIHSESSSRYEINTKGNYLIQKESNVSKGIKQVGESKLVFLDGMENSSENNKMTKNIYIGFLNITNEGIILLIKFF